MKAKSSKASAPRAKKNVKPAVEEEQQPIQADLFYCDVANWPVKDDLASMEIPLFSLAKQKDTEIRLFQRGERRVKIIPSAVGAATVFDKDLLLYIGSQIVAARNEGRPVSRTVRIDSADFLSATKRGDGRNSSEGILPLLQRLRGTTIETNIETGGVLQTEGFGMIESYTILSKKGRHESASGNFIERPLSFTVTVSEWLMNGLMEFEVLTLDKRYFELSKSIERRLYEIGRKHCGEKALWNIGIDLLMEKMGVSRERSKFRADLREIIADDHMPEYRIGLDKSKDPDDVVYYSRDSGKVSKFLLNSGAEKIKWFQAIEK